MPGKGRFHILSTIAMARYSQEGMFKNGGGRMAWISATKRKKNK
jgi:hypothetical protein